MDKKKKKKDAKKKGVVDITVKVETFKRPK